MKEVMAIVRMNMMNKTKRALPKPVSYRSLQGTVWDGAKGSWT